jgi:hypothetical protein
VQATNHHSEEHRCRNKKIMTLQHQYPKLLAKKTVGGLPITTWAVRFLFYSLGVTVLADEISDRISNKDVIAY